MGKPVLVVMRSDSSITYCEVAPQTTLNRDSPQNSQHGMFLPLMPSLFPASYISAKAHEETIYLL